MMMRSIQMAVTAAVKNTGNCKYGIILLLIFHDTGTLLLA
jgi:hypothetical protein